MDWFKSIGQIFEYKEIPEERKVKLVAMQLRDIYSFHLVGSYQSHESATGQEGENLGEDEVLDVRGLLSNGLCAQTFFHRIQHV